ncbi:uncharacterized protein KIAA0930 homolog isoform X2 [Pomacea canaliculata]|uniref:uncharacterized protein KIAA0930 homolog isoform X2 n=1 Tax=Pomacea canaliculata TaxID=400727 RepID=UPI000D72AF73|nr:uncharacterized protein KIAA0930 homolog isoform X2 [Pomacea canaliculata]
MMAEKGTVSPTKPPSALSQMLKSISDERKKTVSGPSDSGFELVPSNVAEFWTDMFVRYFANGGTSPDDSRDDMLFYIRKNPEVKNKYGMIQPLMEVYRRDSKHLPQLDDPNIDWEESVYLNIIMHQFDFTITCAVCTRTSAKDLQILKKCSHRVYASPSQREMDSKGTHEKITYPNIFFTVDAFEEAFEALIVRDSEFVAVELTASDKAGCFQSVLFLGSVKYDALRRTYESRASMTSKVMQRMSFGWYKDKRRVEFMRMRGPMNKGHAEMAVSRVKGSGPETPNVENFPISDFEDDDQNQYEQRRMSDPSSSSGSRFPGGFRRATSLKKSRSDTEKVDNAGETRTDEVEAELDDDVQYNGLWSARSFSQAWYNFKERRRATSVALHANLTYITLPWHRIIADLLENRTAPVLTH